MLRKLVTVMFAALLTLFGFAGIASAAAPYPPTQPPTVDLGGDNIAVVGGNIAVQVGEPYTFSGSGFDPLEGISISISGPSGLRNSAGLQQLLAAAAGVSADETGAFSTVISFDSPGLTTVTATGEASGKSASLVVNVVGGTGGTGGTDGTGGGSTGTGGGYAGSGGSSSGGSGVVVGNGSSGSGGSAGTGGGSGSTGSSSGSGDLAYTGASIAGPLAIGFVALAAGLALLFFGTRGVRRRRQSQSV